VGDEGHAGEAKELGGLVLGRVVGVDSTGDLDVVSGVGHIDGLLDRLVRGEGRAISRVVIAAEVPDMQGGWQRAFLETRRSRPTGPRMASPPFDPPRTRVHSKFPPNWGRGR